MHVIQQLMRTIEERQANPTPRSYTAQLLEAGITRIGEKLLEEVNEVLAAAGEPPGQSARAHVVHEAADVMYHLLVLLAHQGVTLEAVEAELAQRFGVSGLDEKASRKG